MLSDTQNDKEQTQVTFAMDGRYQLAAGVLHINGDFEPKTIQPIINSILEYNVMPREIQPRAITLYVNSHGGLMDQCMALIDAISASIIPVNTVASGTLCSAGFMVFISGHHRIVSSTATLMSHIYSGGAVGSHHALVASQKRNQMMIDLQLRIYKEVTGMSKKKIMKKFIGHQDVWLTPKECVKYGFADEIVDFYQERKQTIKEMRIPDDERDRQETSTEETGQTSEEALIDYTQSLGYEQLWVLKRRIDNEIKRRANSERDSDGKGCEEAS